MIRSRRRPTKHVRRGGSTSVLAGLALAAVVGAAPAYGAQLDVDPSVGVGVASVDVPIAGNSAMYGRVRDEFLSYGLAARLRLGGELMNQTMGYSIFGTQYLGSSIASNLAQGPTWQIAGTPSGKTNLIVLVSAGRSSTSSAFPLDPQVGSTTVVPIGGSTITSAALAETLAYQPSGKMSFNETTGATLSRTTGAADFTSLQLTGLGSAKSLQGRDAYSLNAQAATTSFLSEGANATALGDQGTILTATLTGGWDRQYSAATSTQVQVGGLLVWVPRPDTLAFAPAFLANLNYAANPWFATVSVFQQPIVNSYLGNVVIGDGVTVRLSLPLNALQTWTVSGLAGYTYGRAVGSTLGGFYETDRGYDLITGGANTSYNFQRIPLFVSANATYTKQRGSSLPGYTMPDTTRMLFWVSVGAALQWGEGSRGFRRP